jgi:type I restriction enzyme S subunit
VEDYIFDEKLILIGEDGAKWGAGESTAFSAVGKYWVNNHAHVIRPHRDVIIDEWIIHYLNATNLTPFITGVTVPKLNQAKLRSIPVPVPPLPEQKRIVAILDEAFEGIDQAIANTEKNIANARELLEQIIATRIFSATRQLEWKRTTVADVALDEKGSIRTGPFGSQLLHSEFVDEGIAVLGIDNAVENRFRWGKRRYITEEKFRQLSRYQVKPGDVLITIMGTCGRCAVVPDDISIAINTKHLCCISLEQSRCMPAYLHSYFLHHPAAHEYLLREAKGAIMSGLNMGIIKNLPLLLPPIGEQQQVVTEIEQATLQSDQLLATYDRKLSALQCCKQSILQKAISGGLNQAHMLQQAEAIA